MTFFKTSMSDETVIKCKDELREAHNLNTMFKILDRFYDLDDPLGPLSKNIILNSLPHMMRVIGAKKR